jgi:hypothetical protein
MYKSAILLLLASVTLGGCYYGPGWGDGYGRGWGDGYGRGWGGHHGEREWRGRSER